MAKKFYAVKKGRNPGIYKTWTECQQQINGFSGAVYKGFEDRNEAENFISGVSNQKEELKETQAMAYVDGSFNKLTREFSYGAVIFYNGEELRFSRKYKDRKLAKMQNIAGEIKGAEAAMQYCLDNDISSITIYHDYEGIAKWCTGEWRAEKAGTIAYADFYKKASAAVDIQFVKVKGHSGDKYNDIADKLAKEALGISS